MDGSGYSNGEQILILRKMDNQKLHLFVCGLCDCSFGQFVTFYKHFKNHSKEVGQDSFHICEDLSSLERDVCEDQSESLEMPTFNCGICPASFITVCMLHEHMERHESKGSYTLDMQSKTGYPSPRQYPCVGLGSFDTSCVETSDDTSSYTQVKSIRDRSFKHVQYSGTKRGFSSKNTPEKGKFISPDKEVKNSGGSPTKQRTVDDDSIKTGMQIKRKRGRPRKQPADDDSYAVVESLKEDTDDEDTSIENEQAESEDQTMQKQTTPKIPTSVIVSDQRTFLICEVCGIKKVKQMLVEHVEEKHGCAKLSNGFLELLAELKAGVAKASKKKRKVQMMKDDQLKDADYVPGKTTQHSKRGKYMKNMVKNNHLKDDDYVSEIEINDSMPNMKNIKDNHVLFKLVGKKKRYAKCKHCGIALRVDRIQCHEKAHNTKAGKQKYAPDNMTKCEECGWVMLKKDLQGHKCSDVIIEKRNDKCKEKVQKNQLDNADYVPDVEMNNSMPKVKNIKENHVMLKFVGKNKRYAECLHCGIALRVDRMLCHEKTHKTKAGKRKYAPENMTKCEECGWVMLKKDLQGHKCSEFIIEKRTEPEEERLKIRRKNQQLTPCDVCGVFVKQYLFSYHLRSHSDARPFACPKCPKVFKTKTLLRFHDGMVHGERSFQCDQCPWAFTTKVRLRYHSQTHTGERRYTCTQCGKQFRNSSMLTKHMQVHDANPCYACEECPKVFKYRDTLKTHVSAVHQNIRIWMCSWEGCGKRFKANTHLRRHMLIHTGDKPEKCTICAAAFTQRCNLKVHMKQKHNTDEMPPRNPETPSMSVVPQLILPPTVELAANGEDTEQQCSGTPLRTIEFTSDKSTTEKEKERYQLALLQQALRSGQKTSSTVQPTVQISLDEEIFPVLSLDDANNVQGTNDSTKETKLDCMDVEASQEEEKEVTHKNGSESCFDDDQCKQNDDGGETIDSLTASFMLESNGMLLFRIKKS